MELHSPITEARDPRYLEGIRLFNAGEYFDAHEVWEDLWHETAGTDRRFYQGLIQAAVAVYHAGNGNHRGARRLFDSGRRYMAPFAPIHHGLDVSQMWLDLEAALVDFLVEPVPANAAVRRDRLPTLLCR